MKNFNEEQQKIVEKATGVFGGNLKVENYVEKVVVRNEIEFSKEEGFSMDDNFKLRMALEKVYKDQSLDVDFDDNGNLKVVVETIVFGFENEKPAELVFDYSSIFEDKTFVEAVKLVIENGHAGVAFLQRKLSIGYSRAARYVDYMVDNGYVLPASEKYKVVITLEEFQKEVENHKNK